MDKRAFGKVFSFQLLKNVTFLFVTEMNIQQASEEKIRISHTSVLMHTFTEKLLQSS